MLTTTPHLTRDHAQPAQRGAVWVLPVEWLLYGLLVCLALVLRFAELDTVVPRTSELPDLLAAWRGTPTDSPLLYAAQRFGFSALGGTVLAGRFFTALAGVFIVVLPLLFRAELGRSRAFLLSLLLLVAPPLFIASRTGESVVWAVLVGGVALRLWLTAYRNGTQAVAAVIVTVALVLLTDPAAPLWAGLMLIALVLAVQSTRPDDTDGDEADAPRPVGQFLRSVRWDVGVAAGLLVAFVVSTQGYVQPEGLSGVGALLTGTLGLFSRPTPDAPLWAVLFQMPLTVVLAGAGIWRAQRAGWTALELFFAVWASLGVLALLLLPGLSNAHAVLWVLPVCGLASGALAAVFTRDRLGSIWAQAEADNGDEVAAVLHPDNGRWVLGVIVLALLLMLSVHAQTVGRDLLQSAGGGLGDLLTRLQSNLTLADVRISILWSFIVSMFLLIGYFLAGGLWGNRATLQGYGLGVLLFIVLVQTSAGWYAAVFNAESPTESWDSPTTHRPYHLLRETLDDLMLRETSGFPYLPITVLRDRSVGLDEDGLLGWLLKDQPVQFVDAIEEARAAPLVIASASLTDSTTQSPDLGGSYVGQSFVLSRTWASTSLMGMDVLPWWMQRQTRIQPVPHQTVTLWVRQDVFESVPVTPLTSQAVGR